MTTTQRNRARARVGGKSASVFVHALPYGRVSTQEQSDEGLSLPAQQARILAYVADRGMIAGEWRQDVESGRHTDRANYLALVADVARLTGAGQRVAVVVLRADRLGRNLAEFARCYQELIRAGAALHSVREGGELSPVMAGILGTLAEEESRRIGERVSEVVDHTWRGGWAFPGRVPWGYVRRPATDAERANGAPSSVLDVDQAAAGHVADVYAMADAGTSHHALSRYIGTLPASARGGRLLNRASLARLLASRTYIAEGPDGHAGKWPAIVARDVWERVQVTLAQGATRPPRQASGRYLLTGLLWCGKCGGRMHGNVQKGGRRDRYVCYSRYGSAVGAAAGCLASVVLEVADAQVVAALAPLIEAAPRVLADQLAELTSGANRKRPADERAARLKRARADQTAAGKEVAGLARALARGELSQVAYALAVEGAERDYHAASAEIERLSAAPGADAGIDFAALVKSAAFWRDAWTDADVAARRPILAEFVSRVVAERDADAPGGVRVDVSWTLTGEYIRSLVTAGAACGVAGAEF